MGWVQTEPRFLSLLKDKGPSVPKILDHLCFFFESIFVFFLSSSLFFFGIHLCFFFGIHLCFFFESIFVFFLSLSLFFFGVHLCFFLESIFVFFVLNFGHVIFRFFIVFLYLCNFCLSKFSKICRKIFTKKKVRWNPKKREDGLHQKSKKVSKKKVRWTPKKK